MTEKERFDTIIKKNDVLNGKGQGLVEYALTLMVVAIVVIAIVLLFYPRKDYSYKPATIEGMPCVIVSTPWGIGVTCDWSKYDRGNK